MATYPYNLSIPASGNNPSSDQPKMETNTNSINSIIGEDHYSFGQQTPNNDSANGFHKQVRLPNLPTIPSGTINQSTTIYSRNSNSSGQIFVTNGVSGNEYQMTLTDNTNYGTFGGMYSVTPSDPNITSISAGWTFLPGYPIQSPDTGNQNGALLKQYGKAVLANNIGATYVIVDINLPKSYTDSTSVVVELTAQILNALNVPLYRLSLSQVSTTLIRCNVINMNAGAIIHFTTNGY